MFGTSLTQEHFARYLLLGKTSLGRLKRAEGGIKLGDIERGRFLRTRPETKEAKIRLAPEEFTEALPAAFGHAPQTSTELPLVLIGGGRRAAAYNTWTHNIPKLMERLKGNFAALNLDDAGSLGISDGRRVSVAFPRFEGYPTGWFALGYSFEEATAWSKQSHREYYAATPIDGFLEDVAIWEHKRYLVRPLLCDGDGPIMKLRRWYAQFYPSEPR